MNNYIAITAIVCVSLVIIVTILKGGSFLLIAAFKDLRGKIFVTGNKKNSKNKK